jgi:hypothetical protein
MTWINQKRYIHQTSPASRGYIAGEIEKKEKKKMGI